MNRVVVRSPEGKQLTLTAGQSLIFGRPGGGADLLLGGDVHLSRHHGLIEAHDAGWQLTNVSEVNQLFVDTLEGSLIPLRPGGRWVADRTTVAVGTATMVHQERPLTVNCTVVPASDPGLRQSLPPLTGKRPGPVPASCFPRTRSTSSPRCCCAGRGCAIRCGYADCPRPPRSEPRSPC